MNKKFGISECLKETLQGCMLFVPAFFLIGFVIGGLSGKLGIIGACVGLLLSIGLGISVYLDENSYTGPSNIPDNLSKKKVSKNGGYWHVSTYYSINGFPESGTHYYDTPENNKPSPSFPINAYDCESHIYWTPVYKSENVDN